MKSQVLIMVHKSLQALKRGRFSGDVFEMVSMPHKILQHKFKQNDFAMFKSAILKFVAVQLPKCVLHM